MTIKKSEIISSNKMPNMAILLSLLPLIGLILTSTKAWLWWTRPQFAFIVISNFHQNPKRLVSPVLQAEETESWKVTCPKAKHLQKCPKEQSYRTPESGLPNPRLHRLPRSRTPPCTSPCEHHRAFYLIHSPSEETLLLQSMWPATVFGSIVLSLTDQPWKDESPSKPRLHLSSYTVSWHWAQHWVPQKHPKGTFKWVS